MGSFFAPENTGLTLQKIAKGLAIVAILTVVVGIVLIAIFAMENGNRSYREPKIELGMWASWIGGALAAEIFSCLLLHGFGVLVDSAYQQRIETARQTQLLRQIWAAQKANGAAREPTAITSVSVQQPKVVLRSKPAPMTQASSIEAPEAVGATAAVCEKNEFANPNSEMLDVLGAALSYTDLDQRKQYLLSAINLHSDDQIGMVCRKAVGMDDSQLIDLIAEIG